MTDLVSTYSQRFDTVLVPLANSIEHHLIDLFEDIDRIDRITARPKSIDKFIAKAAKLDGSQPKYSEPIHQIQDQIGARIITFYKSDVERISEIAKKYLRFVENKDIVPESPWEFGYFGKHFVVLVPPELKSPSFDESMTPLFFELQIKTLFEHAWSEANHDLGYKPETELDKHAKRRLAFTSAQAWGADQVFDELHREGSN